MKSTVAGVCAALLLSGCAQATASGLAFRDPPPDPAHPADMAAFVIPAQDGAMNAMMYLASGAAPHPPCCCFTDFRATSRTSISRRPRGGPGGTC